MGRFNQRITNSASIGDFPKTGLSANGRVWRFLCRMPLGAGHQAVSTTLHTKNRYFVISSFPMAKAVSSAALCRLSFFIRFARCFSTVLTLMQS